MIKYLYHCEKCKRKDRFDSMRQTETACLFCGGKMLYDGLKMIEKTERLVLP